QEQARVTPIAVAGQPLKFDLVPESGNLVPGVPNTVFVFASTPDGLPAKVKGTFIYGNEKTPKEFSTSELGVGSIEIRPVATPSTIHLTATDSAGRVVTHDSALALGQIAPDFLFRTDKAVYSGGESMKVTALGAGLQPVFVDILKDGQSLRSGLIELRNGRGEWTVDLPPELAGVLQLWAYRFDAKGYPVRKTRLAYVRSAKGIAVTATADKPEYRPGEKTKISFNLKYSAGKPVLSALSLAAVDPAAF